MFTEQYQFQVGRAVPDGSSSGLTDVQTVNSQITTITDVDVTFAILGDFNGDLYAWLRKGDDFSVLLNRPGRTQSEPLGSADPGLSITLDDDAPNGDIHDYRVTLFGNASTPLDSPLTGFWAPDGRNVDPAIVFDSDQRTADLSVFDGVTASGDWTLFVADVSSGGTAELNQWGLTFTGVPEPGLMSLLGVGLGVLGLRRARRS